MSSTTISIRTPDIDTHDAVLDELVPILNAWAEENSKRIDTNFNTKVNGGRTIKIL